MSAGVRFKAMPPASLDLLRAVRDGNVIRREFDGGMYDWDETRGIAVTVQMSRLRVDRLVSLVGSERGRTGRWRLTKAGHEALAEAGLLVETED